MLISLVLLSRKISLIWKGVCVCVCVCVYVCEIKGKSTVLYG